MNTFVVSVIVDGKRCLVGLWRGEEKNLIDTMIDARGLGMMLAKILQCSPVSRFEYCEIPPECFFSMFLPMDEDKTYPLDWKTPPARKLNS